MKQGFRFFFRPGAFVNQLQWSSHHGFILAAFLTSALVETQAGRHQGIFGQLALALSAASGTGLDLAIWLVVFAKLAVMLLGALALGEVILWLGSVFGRKGDGTQRVRVSRRVLFRRLAVVLSLFLLAHAAQAYAVSLPAAPALSLALGAWGFLIGYFALREQFSLTMAETLAIGGFAVFLAVGAWNLTMVSLQKTVRHQAPAIARKNPRTAPRAHFRPFFK